MTITAGFSFFKSTNLVFHDWKQQKGKPAEIIVFYQKAYPLAIAGYAELFHEEHESPEHTNTINRLYKRYTQSKGKLKMKLYKKITEHMIEDSKIVHLFQQRTAHLRELITEAYMEGIIEEGRGEIGYEEDLLNFN